MGRPTYGPLASVRPMAEGSGGLALRPLGRTGILVSELGLGTLTFGASTDERTSRTIFDRFVDLGGNFIDTADVYNDGTAETIVAKLIRPHRDRVILATKGRMATGPGPNCQGASRRYLTLALEASLRRLETEWVDLYQVHWPDPATPQEETLSVLADFVRSGKVRYIGASNYAGWQFEKALGISVAHGWPHFSSLQAQYSLACREAELELIPMCLEEQSGLLVWGPLGGGILSGKYSENAAPRGTRLAESPEIAQPVNARTVRIIDAVRQVALETKRSPAQVALRWVLDRPGVTAAVVGARTVEQMSENLSVAGWQLGTEHVETLDKVSQIRLVYPHDLARAFGYRS